MPEGEEAEWNSWCSELSETRPSLFHDIYSYETVISPFYLSCTSSQMRVLEHTVLAFTYE